MMELTGEIPGLLRRSTPVVDRRRFYSDGEHAWQDKPPRGIWSPQGPKADEGLVLWDRSAGQRQRVEERVYAGNLLVDSEDATGRFHCREWLRDRGHDVGNEDRAEVLAWSVLSVWRGGKPLRVLPAWNAQPSFGMAYYVREADDGHMVGRAHYQHWWVGQAPKFQGVTALLCGDGYDDGQWTATGIAEWEHDNDWRCGQRACDVRLLTLGWALTNDDGSLTLPPLPVAK